MARRRRQISNDDRTALAVMELLEASADVPQRRIAALTGVNLAKVNFILRRLIDKGFVKLKRVRENPHKLRYLYLLTPEGEEYITPVGSSDGPGRVRRRVRE